MARKICWRVLQIIRGELIHMLSELAWRGEASGVLGARDEGADDGERGSTYDLDSTPLCVEMGVAGSRWSSGLVDGVGMAVEGDRGRSWDKGASVMSDRTDLECVRRSFGARGSGRVRVEG